MAITINNLQTLRSETNGTAFTLSNYAATAGTNRLLLVRVHAMRTAETDFTLSATFNGVSMTEAVTLSDISTGRRYRTTIFYLIAPAEVTANIVATASATIQSAIVTACTLLGAAQSSVVGATDTDSPGNVTAVTLSLVSTSANSFIFAAVTSTSASSPTWSWSGATEQYDLSGSNDTTEIAGSGAYFECDGGNETIVATRGVNSTQIGVAAEIKAASVAGGSRVRHRLLRQGLRLGLQPGF